MVKNGVSATILGGLVAGALDIIYACVHYGLVYGAPPMRIFQSVAGGALGPEAARAGGWVTASFGLGLHFLIAAAMAAIFVAAAKAMPSMNRWPPLAAVVYGLGLYAFMNYVAVPFSAAGDGVPHPPQGQFLYGALFAHTVLVALPIALITKRFATR